MTYEHNPSNQIPINNQTSDYWIEGHPNFKPFYVGQRVIREIAWMGDRAVYKLQAKYDGPYIVKKVQSNGLSYEIVKESDESTVYKCNHRKLRAYHSLPQNIKQYLPRDDASDVDENSSDETEESSESNDFEGCLLYTSDAADE